MKTKVKSLFLSVLLLLFSTFSFISCSTSKTYEDQFLGFWICSSGGKIISYQFKQNDDGTYYALGSTKYGSEPQSTYWFDEFSASRTVLTLKQKGGKQMKYYYSFEGEYLYLDGLEFERLNYE